jgi:gliding motility-associated-like protein
MKKIIIIIIILLFKNGFSQTVSVDNATQTPVSLVNTLIGNSCIEVSNISISSAQSVGYFNRNNSSFPINEGIIIRNGNAKFSEGSYTGTNLDSQVNSNNDAALQALVAAQGQTGNITDVAFLEFDFVPLSNNFSFDFLFASNEYGQYQCASFDTFAFLLTDLTTNITTNLAVIPGTNTPVSVLSIRDNAYNSGCSSSNSQLFSTYNVTNAAASTINMRGFTNVMNASSIVNPNNPYRIRLVIGDYSDFRFDSAVFLSAGSFITTIDLGEDTTICTGNTQTITTGLDNTIYNHVWTRNGVVLSEISNSLIINEPGTYNVTVTTNTSNCIISDEIIFYELSLNPPVDLIDCFTTNGASHNYNLTLNNESFLEINDTLYDLFYFASLADITSNTPIPASEITNYASLGNETIYVKIFNTQSNEFCDANYSFDLLVEDEIPLITPPILSECAVTVSTAVNLSNHFLFSNPINTDDFTITYFESLSNAQTFANEIIDPFVYIIPNGNSTTSIWVRVSNINFPDCYSIVNFDVVINLQPEVDTLDLVLECSEYTLPPLTNGNYFTGPFGTGTPLNAGDIVDTSGTYYVFIGPDSNGCLNQSTFEIFLAADYEIQTDYCGQFSVPAPLLGEFYTQTGGPNGSGTLLAPGTILNVNQTIYYYAEVNDVFCIEKPISIVVNMLPPITILPDVITCNSYTLEAIPNGNYYDSNGGFLSNGSQITESQQITIINGPDANGCSNFSFFNVTIINNIVNQTACGSYTLPALSVGEYYTLTGGPNTTGNVLIPQLTEINTVGTNTFYIYAETSTAPNCTENLSFIVEILPRPLVDDLADVIECGSYALPNLTNGNYYLLPGGPNAVGQVSYFAGQIVDLSGIRLNPGTFYIYSPPDASGCDNQSSFEVIINPLPVTPEVSDFSSCQPYSLPNPSAGNYYTEPNGPNGTGILVTASTLFTETRTFYLYSQDPNTLCFVDKPFTVFYNTLGLPDFDNINECDSYTLPNLTFQPTFPNDFEINYYSQPGGNIADIIDPSAYTFSTVGTYDVYVYATNGDRFFACTEEKSFTISISETPVLTPFSSIESCGSYTLPALPASTFNINYYTQTNGAGLITPSNYTFSTPGTYDIYVYTDNPTNANCNDEEHFVLTIYPLLNLNIDDEIICVDPITRDPIGTVTLQSGLNPSFFEVNWLFNNQLVFTGPNFTTSQSGIYTIETTKLFPVVGADCNYDVTTAQVFESSSAIATIFQSSDFDEVSNLTIEITNGLGTYEFSLDGGPYQTSNIFNNVSSGEHIVTIRDTFGNCDVIMLETIVLKYPQFFTPNGDNNNETWNIFDMQDFPEAMITIFDRYGKLIKQFSPATFGWDGTFNGYSLPATDYWFVVNYNRDGQEKIFKSHFSLVR